MKNISFLFLFIILFSNCKLDKKEESNSSLEETKSKEEPFVLNIQKIDSTQFPASIKYEGFIKNAVRWKDKLGDNIVITTETVYHFNKKFTHEFDNSSDAELFAYHFLISGNEVKQIWKVYDYIADCPVDLDVSFIKNTFQITDLNHNGLIETWLMYKTACQGGVDPAVMKIIMYEGNQKYAMRGVNKVMDGIDDNAQKHFSGGEYKLDVSFKKGPKVFKDFAQKLWKDNLIEN